MKEEIMHNDKLGRALAVGDCVAYPASNSMIIGVIKKFTPKMVSVGNRKRGAQLKYPFELVRLDGPEVSVYVLKESL